MFNLKNADAQSINVQSLTFRNLNEAVIDALFSQISLSFKFKIIKLEKMKIYKNQSEKRTSTMILKRKYQDGECFEIYRY